MRILFESSVEAGVANAGMNERQAVSDAELLRRGLAGDEDAFRAVYERLKSGIFRYAFYMTNSRTTAEEVTQEVFLTLLRKGEQFDSAQGDVGAFTFGFARNIVHRALRREKYQRLLFAGAKDEVAAEPASASDALTTGLIRGENVLRVRAAIGALPEHYRQVVVLCDLCELSYGEAAARLECAVGTIRSRLNRAHGLLARKLKLPIDAAKELRDNAEGCLT